MLGLGCTPQFATNMKVKVGLCTMATHDALEHTCRTCPHAPRSALAGPGPTFTTPAVSMHALHVHSRLARAPAAGAYALSARYIAMNLLNRYIRNKPHAHCKTCRKL